MKKTAFIILFLLMGLTHVFLGKTALTSLSPTFDEPVHLTAGYIYWTMGNYKRQYRFNGFDHPPFGEMWANLPLLFLKPKLPLNHPAWASQRWRHDDQYPFADEFVYKNHIPADRLIAAGRAALLAL